jgi:hypothetical protein
MRGFGGFAVRGEFALGYWVAAVSLLTL